LEKICGIFGKKSAESLEKYAESLGKNMQNLWEKICGIFGKGKITFLAL
jgi:hypothetical protein